MQGERLNVDSSVTRKQCGQIDHIVFLYAQTVFRHLHCSVRLTQVELSADKNVAVHSCNKAS